MFFITYELWTSHTAYHVPSAPRLWTYSLVTRYVVPNLLVLHLWLCGWAPLYLSHILILLLFYCHLASWVCTGSTWLNNYRPANFRPFTIPGHLSNLATVV